MPDRASDGVITNGAKIVVPEGCGLVLLPDGAFTGLAAQPGGYVWDSDEPATQSILSGGGLVESVVRQSWERSKLGGRPATEQTALFVALTELSNNRFGTQSEVYRDDAFLNTQVGAITRGTYTLKIHRPARLHPQLRARGRDQRTGRLSAPPTPTTQPGSSCSTRWSPRWAPAYSMSGAGAATPLSGWTEGPVQLSAGLRRPARRSTC